MNTRLSIVFLLLILLPFSLVADRADDLLKQADQAYFQGKLKQSESLCLAALKENPNLADAYRRLGWINWKRKAYEESLHFYDKAMQLEPRNPKHYNGKANSLYKLKRYQESIDLCTQAIIIKEDYTQGYYTRGLCFEALGKNDQAKEDYHKSIEIEPDFSYGYNGIGVIHLKRKELDAALRFFSRANELQPKDAIYLKNRGSTLLGMAKWSASIKDLDKSVTINPNDAHAWFQLGRAHRGKNDLNSALKAYTKALELRPNYPVALNNRANLFWKLKQNMAAYMDYKMGLLLAPNHKLLNSNFSKFKNANTESLARLTDFDKAIEQRVSDLRKKASSEPIPPSLPIKRTVTTTEPWATFSKSDLSGNGSFPAFAFATSADRFEDPVKSKADRFWTAKDNKPIKKDLFISGLTAPIPEPITWDNLTLVDYNATVSMAMELMRQVYGPMNPQDEQRFQMKWAPLFDHPSDAILEYLNKLNPLLGQFLTVRGSLTEALGGFHVILTETSYAEGFREPDALEGCLSRLDYQQKMISALQGRLQLIAKEISELGDPPNPIEEKIKRRKRFFDQVQQVNDLIGELGSQPAANTSPGTYVLVDSFSYSIPAIMHPFRGTINISGNSIYSKKECIPDDRSKKGYVQAYQYSWNGIPSRIELNETTEVTLRIDDGGCEGTTYYAAGLKLWWGSASGTPEEIERYIGFLKTWSTAYESGSAWYWKDLGAAGTQVDTHHTDMPGKHSLTELSTEEKIAESFNYHPFTDQPTVTGQKIHAMALKVSPLDGAGIAEVYYIYLYDPTGTQIQGITLDEANQGNQSTVETENPAELRKQFHRANKIYFQQRLADLRNDLARTKDKSSRDSIQWQILATEANLQGESDAIRRLETGQWIRTRTRFDDLCAYQSTIQSLSDRAKWNHIRRKITVGYRALRNAPIEQRDDLRRFLDRQLSAETIASGDVQKIDKIVKLVGNSIVDAWEHESASQQAKAWELEETIFILQSVKTGAAILLTMDASKLALQFGATAVEANWFATGVGAMYGGTTGYIEGGPGRAVEEAVACVGVGSLAAVEAYREYSRQIKSGKDWKEAMKSGAKHGAYILVLGKGLEYGVKGLSYMMRGKPPNVKEAFEQARFKQQLEMDQALLDHYARKQWELASSVSRGGSMSTVRALQNEIRGLTGSINASYGAKWLLKHKANKILQQAFIENVEHVYDDVMPVFYRRLESLGYNVQNLRFRPIRNASSGGSTGMDWDVAFDDETVAIFKNGRRVSLHTLQQDAQEAMNNAYFHQTGFSAKATDISMTTSIHPEAYWDRAWLESMTDFEGLDPKKLNQEQMVTRFKAANFKNNPHLNAIQRTQEMCRGGSKDMNTKLLPYLDHKIQQAVSKPQNQQQVARLRELRKYWSSIRNHMNAIGKEETDPEMIRQQTEAIKRLTGGKDVFEVIETMGDFWKTLNKWI